MRPEPLTLILQRLDNEPPLFFAEEVEEYLGNVLARLLHLGVLRETTPSGTAACRDCGYGYVGRVEFITSTRTGRPHAYIPCPECGPVEVSPDRLRRWLVDVTGLLGALAAAAGIRGPTGEVVPGRLWRIGRATWAQRSREIYFARHVHAPNRDTLVAEMSRRPKSLLFVPTEANVRNWGGATTNLVLALESVLTLGPDALTFDHSFVESRLSDAGLTGEVKTKRKPRKRGERAAKIEALKKELIQHLLAARDHARATADRSGTPKLLPRPAQKQLARLAGLTESDVSRCLADPEARELRLLWETAADLDRILSWSGPIRTAQDD